MSKNSLGKNRLAFTQWNVLARATIIFSPKAFSSVDGLGLVLVHEVLHVCEGYFGMLKLLFCRRRIENRINEESEKIWLGIRKK